MSGNLGTPPADVPNGNIDKNRPATAGGDDAAAEKPVAEGKRVSPEMLFKISKKIAQLTKVIYTLNTRNDDLEQELDQLRVNTARNSVATSDSQRRPSSSAKNADETPEQLTCAAAAAQDAETKKELRRARHIMKHLEAKMKAMQEDQRKQMVVTSPMQQQSGLEKQVKQMMKDKLDLTRRLDHLDLQKEQLRLENEQLRKDVGEANRDRSELQLLLSTARVQLKYGGMQQEKVKSDITRGELSGGSKKQLPQQQQNFPLCGSQRKSVESSKKSVISWQQRQQQQPEEELQNREREVRTLREEVARLTQQVSAHESEVRNLQHAAATATAAATAVQVSSASRLRSLESELAGVQQRLQEAEAMTSAVNKELAAETELHLLTKQTLVAAEDKGKSTEEDRDRWKLRCEQAEVNKMEMNLLTLNEKAGVDKDEMIRQLEKALDGALDERHEILEAAAKEIEHQKNMALSTEQKLMEDYEWKLRELQAENRKKVKDLERSIETRVVVANRDYETKKDAEFTKMSIDMRRESEERIRVDRNNLKAALDRQSAGDLEVALSLCRMEKDRELRVQQKQWEEERTKLAREKRSLQRKLDELPCEVAKAVKVAKSECEALMLEEKRKMQRLQEKFQEDYDAMRHDLGGQLTRLRSEHAEKLVDLESRLEKANSNRFSSMFQMKEEVEIEFGERMEQLRSMYKEEIDQLSAQLQSEKDSGKSRERVLAVALEEKQAEVDGLNTYYAQREEEYEAKVTDLLTRLSEQTALAQKLQAELDEYDFYDEEEGDEHAKQQPQQQQQQLLQHLQPHQKQQQVEEEEVVSGNFEDTICEPIALSEAIPTAEDHHATEEEEETGNPEPPPRSSRDNKVEEVLAAASVAARLSWHEESSRTTAAEPPSSSTTSRTSSTQLASSSRHSSTLPSSLRAQRSSAEAVEGAVALRRGNTLSRMFKMQSPKVTKRSPHSCGGSNSSSSSKKSTCTHQ